MPAPSPPPPVPLPAPPPAPRGPLAALARLVTARPWVTVGLAVTLTAAALAAALQLEPATGVQDMLADDQPSAIAFGQMVERYALVDDLIVIAELPETPAAPPPPAEPADADAGIARLIRFARALEHELADEPAVAAVRFRPAADARAFVQDVVVPRGWDYLDAEGRARLRQRLTREAMDAQFAQNAAMLAAPGPAAGRLARELIRDPLRLRDFLSGSLAGRGAGAREDGFRTRRGVDANVSTDGQAILINVGGAQPASDLAFTADFMPRIRAAVAAAQGLDPTHPPLVVRYTGAYAIAEHSAGQTRADMIASCTASVALLIGGFLLVYRHPLAFPVLLLPVYMAIVWAFGLYAVSAGHLTPVTAVTGAVLAGLGIDYCVHYVAAHELERRRTFNAAGAGDRDPNPALRRAAALRAIDHVGPAIIAAALTTVLGFGVVAFSHVRALREFAALGVIGLVAALVTALLVLPPLLLALGRTPAARGGLSATRFSIAPAVLAVARAPRGWLAATLALVLTAAATLGLAAARDAAPLRFDRDLHALHPRPHPPLDTQDHLAQRFGAAPNGLTLLVESDTPQNMLALAHAVQRRFAGPRLQDLGLSGVTGPATLLPDPVQSTETDEPRPDPARVVHDLRSAAEAAGFRPGAFDDYARFLTRLFTPRPPPTFDEVRRYPALADLVLPKDTPAPTQGLVLATLRRPWANADERDRVIDTVRNELADLNHNPQRPADRAVLSGISVLGYDTQQAISAGLGRLLALSGGAVLLWLLVFFRRPLDVLLALSPAAGGLVLMLAAVWLSGGSFNLINLIAVPLLVGIGVDDGIFLTALYRRARRAGSSAARLREDLAASAHAIGMTSLTTTLAFGSLYFTQVPAIKSLGLMVGAGVAGAFVVSVGGLVPGLVMLYGRNQNKK